MKTFALATAFALMASAAMAADPIEGIWQTQADEGALAIVSIAPCGGAFCGTIAKTFKGKEAYKSPNIGKQIVIGMAVTRTGIPIRVWCWPGNTSDSALIRQVRSELRDLLDAAVVADTETELQRLAADCAWRT